MGAHVEHVIGASGLDHGIGVVAAIGNGGHRGVGAGNDVAAHETGDRRATERRNRHRHPHAAGRHVPLPAHPEQREALRHERPVAELRLGRRVVGASRLLEHGEDALRAAIAGLVEQPAVAARRIDRLQQVEIRRGLDQPARVDGGEREIDDALVARRLRVEGEMDAPDDFFVGTGGAESAAAEHRLAARDLETGDAALRHRGKGQEDRHDEVKMTEAHAPVSIRAGGASCA